uniref:Uncharacterized protein n=1 Tax=Panagrolaimus sp. PS1159 TaxID=55785 RepID=A0AC35EW62_9BILA
MNPPPPPASNDDTATHQQLYRAYLNFWNSFNNCVDDEYKIIPENGTRPTYREAKNLWKAMKRPRQRKLLWVATGFLHDDFPNDEAEFRREEEAGLINETNVTTGADEEFESSSDDDEDVDIPDMNDENIPPVDAGAPQNFGDPNMSPVQAEIASTDNAAAALSPHVVVATVPPVATPSVADQLAAAEVENEVVEDSQMDECVDAFVENVQDDYCIEEPDHSPPGSPIHDSLQNFALIDSDSSVPTPQLSDSDSSVPTPQLSYPNSQIPTSTAPKGISSPKKRRIFEESDEESDKEMKDLKLENDETSYIDEQIALIQQDKARKSKPMKRSRKKKSSPKPSTSKPILRVRTRNSIRVENKREEKTNTARRHSNEINSDNSEKSETSHNSVLDSDNVSDGSESSYETSSLDGFIQYDSGSEEELYDSITISNPQKNVSLEDSDVCTIPSILNDEIYTRDDSVERDLPATIPRATIKNSHTTPKTTPFLAHRGTARYSSDAATTTPRRPPAPALSSKSPSKSVGRNETPSNVLSRQSQRSGEPSDQPFGPASSSLRKIRRVHFGSVTRFVDDDSNSSRSSSLNSINSSLANGYEEIPKNNKRTINGFLYIFYERNNKKYYRKYKAVEGLSYFNSHACHNFYCFKCKTNGKNTLVKIMAKSNKIYAETDHVPPCDLEEYTQD